MENDVNIEEWAKYRWEFMRRDPNYRKAYGEFKQLVGDLPIIGNNHIAESNVFNVQFSKIPHTERDLFCQQWYKLRSKFDFLPDIDPNKSFDELKEHSQCALDKLYDVAYSTRIMTNFHDTLLICTVDFDKVNSVERLIDGISHHIRKRYKEYDDMRKSTNIYKIYMTDYSIILRCGDMRAQGLTHGAIAKALFPDDKSPESAVRKVGHYCKKYEKLVNGGYKDLRYP